MSKGTVVVFLFALAASIPHVRAQTSGEVKKNEAGLLIGATVTPSQTLASSISATPRTPTFKSSLPRAPKFDHRLNTSERLGVLARVDFFASPLDVKLDQRPVNVIPQYAISFQALAEGGSMRAGAAD